MAFSHDLSTHNSLDMNMDGAIFSSSIMQSNDMDVQMGGLQEDSHNNGHLQNGTIDPRQVFDRTNGQTIAQINAPEDVEESDAEESSSQSSLDRKLVSQPRRFALLPTGCCYDDRMRLHANADFSSDPHHPEDPRRIESIMKAFKDASLLYTGPDEDLAEILKESPSKWMWRIAAREATDAEICTVHTPSHLAWVQSLAQKSSAELRDMTERMDTGRKSLYVGNLTHAAALISAGGAIETCKNVVEGNVKNAIAVIRPPGHHAEPDEAMGFCIFNNVPIAAAVCRLDYPECRKVLILDWDVHHGNGTQTMFYDEPNVLYISIHVYQGGSFYPAQPEDGSPDGGMENIGEGRGVGRNVNIPWDEQGMGDGDYLAAFQRIVMPIAQEFNPDLVIVSAGFDAAAGDELGGCFVSPACYSHMTHMLMSLANGKVAVCLEGGYNLPAISKSALAVAKTLMGEPPERISIKDCPLNKKADEVLHEVQRHQAPYWECMRRGIIEKGTIRDQDGLRLSDVIQSDKRRRLADKHNMVSLFIQREALSKSFQGQVLATPNLCDAKRILFIIHDPPDIIAQPNLTYNKVYAENAWTKDVVVPYIDWAIGTGFGVLDVNIPTNNNESDDEEEYSIRPSETVLEQQMKELLLYLWDNYLSITPVGTQIILMGVGESYLGIKQLLLSRPQAIRTHIQGVLAFVSASLKPVRSETDPSLSKVFSLFTFPNIPSSAFLSNLTLAQWYKENSRIYVSPDHSVWTDEDNAKRVRSRKYGTVVKSDKIGLSAMLRRYGPRPGEGNIIISRKRRKSNTEQRLLGAEAIEFILDRCGLDDEDDEDETEEDDVGN